jgi:hypothetical protein
MKSKKNTIKKIQNKIKISKKMGGQIRHKKKLKSNYKE